MPTILSIDDDASVRRLIHEVLERAGYNVLEASNMPDIARQLARADPEVIILDCSLGGRGAGLDVLRQLRARPGMSHVPVVLTTILPDADNDLRLRHCGASAFLRKPFAPRDLVAAVAFAMAQHEGAAQAC